MRRGLSLQYLPISSVLIATDNDDAAAVDDAWTI